MFGLVLKVLGLIVLVVGFVGMIAGGILFLFGHQQVQDSDDGLLFSDRSQAEAGEQAMTNAAGVFGSSLMIAGAGLAVMVAGIFVSGKGPVQQQQQQVVVLSGDATVQRPPQMRQ